MTTATAKRKAEEVRAAIQKLIEDFENKSGLVVRDIFNHPNQQGHVGRIEIDVTLDHVTGR